LLDYLLLFAVAIITASAVIMGSFLARYRQLVKEADSSTRLAKDVWDMANSRFSLVDARIIDLMAKSEVFSSRLGLPKLASHQSSSTITSPQTSQEASRQISQPTSQPAPGRATPERPPVVQFAPATTAKPPGRVSTKTENQVLGLLATGPKSSAEIKTQLNVSREHTARLMKGLFDRGLVARNDRNKPYVYEITESGKSYVGS
jgi:DNA-binding HxlR family transcriptional regulator